MTDDAKTAATLARQLGEDMLGLIHSPSYTDEDFLKQITAIGENLLTLWLADHDAALTRSLREQIGELKGELKRMPCGHVQAEQFIGREGRCRSCAETAALAQAVREQCAPYMRHLDSCNLHNFTQRRSECTCGLRALPLPGADRRDDFTIARVYGMAMDAITDGREEALRIMTKRDESIRLEARLEEAKLVRDEYLDQGGWELVNKSSFDNHITELEAALEKLE